MRRKRGRPAVEDGPITLVAQTGFETEIETTTITRGHPTEVAAGEETLQVEDTSSSPLGQVCLFISFSVPLSDRTALMGLGDGILGHQFN
jgi:hypothetical protein